MGDILDACLNTDAIFPRVSEKKEKVPTKAGTKTVVNASFVWCLIKIQFELISWLL